MLSIVEEKIIECILLSQIASDGGKRGKIGIPNEWDEYLVECLEVRIRNDFTKKGFYAFYDGYPSKDIYVLKAIKAIIESRNTTVFHYEIYEDQYNGRNCFIVTFNFLMRYGGRYSLSFHSFDPTLESYVNANKPERRETYQLKRSQKTAKKLLKYYLENRYEILPSVV